MQSFLEWVFPAQRNVVGFEDVLYAKTLPKSFVLLSTLENPSCLIRGTLSPEQEVVFVNELLQKYTDATTRIVVYGENAGDERPYRKQTQLRSLGIGDVWVYAGGLFEWLLLQDVYGETEFPTTTAAKENDLLKWKMAKRW